MEHREVYEVVFPYLLPVLYLPETDEPTTLKSLARAWFQQNEAFERQVEKQDD